MGYWLIKSEPSKKMWSTIQKKGAKGCFWKRVRNYQARNYMKQMKKGDQCFFYHSVDEKQIVGVVEVTKEYYPDETDDSGRFVLVNVKTKKKLKQPVTLKEIKLNPILFQKSSLFSIDSLYNSSYFSLFSFVFFK